MTRHQAVEDHRKMWKWITEQLERMTEEEAKRINIFILKKAYINDHCEELIKRYGINITYEIENSYCFLCCYARLLSEISGGSWVCDSCPVKVDDDIGRGTVCLGGLYGQTENRNPLKKRIKAARTISELPENENIKDIDITY